jgi:hypothetical protein
MEVSAKNLAISSAVLLIAGLAIGRFTLPAKVVTKTQIQVQTQEVVKWQTKYVENQDDHKNTTIIETKKPDGTDVIETHISDSEDTSVNSSSGGSNSTQTSEKETQSKTVTYAKNDWHLNALASPSGDGKLIDGKMSYGGQVERRIMGPFYLGAFGLQNSTFGVSVGVSF